MQIVYKLIQGSHRSITDRLKLKLLIPVTVALSGFISCLEPAVAGVMMQGFYWDAPSDHHKYWWDRLAEESHELAESGFTAIWIPPPHKGAAGGFSNGYDPFDDYDIGSKDQRGTIPTRWGTREQLARSVAMMRANGLEVYADMVLAHRNGDSGDKRFTYRNSLGAASGGRFEKSPEDFAGDSNGFGRYLNHGRHEVHGGLCQAGDWLMKALDVQGIRIDVASQVPPEFLGQYLSHGALASKLTIAEYWNEDVEVLLDYVHKKMQGRVNAFDFPLWGKLRAMSNAKGLFKMSELVKAGLAGRDPVHAVTFVENHDTDKNFPTLSNKHLGYAYILTSEGYPTVFWKDYFEHGMKPIINPLIWIHENLADGPTEYRWADDDLLVYERRGKQGLIVGLNDNMVSERRETVQTAWAPGTRLHDYTGNKPDIEVDSSGKVSITVGANSYVAYAPVGIEVQFPNEVYEVNQEFAGADDLDIRPAMNGDFQHVGRIFSEAKLPISWELHFGPHGESQKPGKGRIALRILDPDGKEISLQTAELNKENAAAPVIAGSLNSEKKGWYVLQVRAEELVSEVRVPFWLKMKYRAPQTL